MTLLRNIWFIQMVANMYKSVQDFKNLVSLRRITGVFCIRFEVYINRICTRIHNISG